jgi:ubiquinone/menaquinone biosynthesis C-methylase UbiE
MDRKAIREAMQGVYERQAAHFDAQRDKSGLETAWLARFAAGLPAGASILDAGCGTGDPVSRWFIERGYGLTGVDYAAAMIAIAETRFPQARWRLADMRTLDLGERFDAVLSWHGFFHLSPAEQRIGLERLCAHLKPGGVSARLYRSGRSDARHGVRQRRLAQPYQKFTRDKRLIT